jgi:hypothetical protein
MKKVFFIFVMALILSAVNPTETRAQNAPSADLAYFQADLATFTVWYQTETGITVQAVIVVKVKLISSSLAGETYEVAYLVNGQEFKASGFTEYIYSGDTCGIALDASYCDYQ